MTQAIKTPTWVNFEEFVDWYPEKSEYRYELHNRVIVQMPLPKGKHSQVAGFLMTELSLEIRRLKKPFFVPRECLIKGDADSGYQPDVLGLNRDKVEQEPLWAKQSTLISGEAIALVIEVVSTNWRDDYALKIFLKQNKLVCI